PTVAPTLPREQRSSVALFACRPPCRAQSTVSVFQERPSEDRQPVVEQREDEQLIPEDVSPVRLAVQAASRNPDIEVDGVRGQTLEQMEHVQPQQELRPLASRDRDLEPLPQSVPCQTVTLVKLAERVGPDDPRARLVPGVRRSVVPGR